MEERGECRGAGEGESSPVPASSESATQGPDCVPGRVDRFADSMYALLHRGAARTVRQELRRRRGAVWGGTSLLHDAYIRLREGGVTCPRGVDEERYCWGAFAIAMRRLLVERARRRLVRSERIDALSLEESIQPLAGVEEPEPRETLRLEDALRTLLVESPELHEVFALRHFAGLAREEIARLRGSRVEEVKRQLEVARARLRALIEAADRGNMGRSDETPVHHRRALHPARSEQERSDGGG